MAFKKYKAKKDPDSTIDYGRTWGGDKGFLSEFELITDSVWFISCAKEETPTLIEVSSGISVDGKDTSVWLTGGTIGLSYDLTNRIETGEGRIEDRTGTVTVQEK